MPHLFSLLGYRRYWNLLSLLAKKSISQSAPIVIGGSERSGTTLLRVLLSRHPDIACGRESTVFLRRISGPRDIGPRFDFDPELIESWQRESRSQVEFIERFQDAVLASEGKPVWAEKTPANVSRFTFIRRHFPDARLIHIIRDGRDVVCSLRRQTWARLHGHHWTSPEALRICADHWAQRVRAGRRLAGDPLYLELHYEDLVRETEPTLRRVLDFAGLDWSDRLLVPEASGRDADEIRARSTVGHESVGRWQHELNFTERELLGRRIGQLLVDLGYQPDPRCTTRDRSRKQVLALGLGSVARLQIVPQPGGAGLGRLSYPKGPLRWFQRLLSALPRPVRTSLANLHVLYLAAKDRRVPWLARAVASMGVAYYLSPIDLIPDSIPVVGYLDDIAVVWLSLRFAVALAPTSVMAELRDVAATTLSLS